MSGNCGKCIKKFKQTQSKVECSDCKANFHLNCANVTSSDLEYLEEKSEIWRCDPCSKTRRKSMLLDNASQSITFDDVYNLVSQIKTDLSKVEKSLGNSLNSCHDEISELKKTIQSQQEEILGWKELLQKVTNENKLLKDKVVELEVRQDRLEQYSRRNTVEIHGVPQSQGENVVELVKKVGQALNYPIDDSMIDACHRLKPKQGSSYSPGIIVKMVRRSDAHALLEHRRKKKQDFSTRHMGLPTDTPVYINESLSSGRRRVLQAAREAKREKHYQYLWIRNSQILLRKESGSPVVSVETLEDVSKL